MITVKAPNQYWNKPGILGQSAPRLAPLGKRALIIAGKTAWSAVSASLIGSLAEANIDFEIAEFGGYCTAEEIGDFAKLAEEKQADLLIGVGGGKALDLTKAVGDQLDLPVVTVPTVAATCAAWSALTVLYDAQGRSQGYLPLKNSPVLVLADTRVLASAPKRFLAAGIGDTWVKWYEVAVNIRDEADELDVQIGTQTAKLALEILQRHAPEAYETAGSGEVTRAFTETVDAIILLAGLVGSVHGPAARAAIAHSIHNSLTYVPETKGTLHGEKVAFSLLSQVVLEGRSDGEVHELAAQLRQFDLPVTLAALGIERDPALVAGEVARGVQLRTEPAARLAFAANAEALANAIQAADRAGRQAIQKTYAETAET